MSRILYGNLRIDLLTDAGARVERISLERSPSLAPRQPATAADAEAGSLPAREDELRQVRLAVATGRPVELVAACGFGKTSLLHQIASTIGGEGGRASVYLRLGNERLDDTLQRLFDASFTSRQPFKPTAAQRDELLGQVTSLVLLDDVTLHEGDVGKLVASLPNCRLILGSTRPLLGRHGISMQLAGLHDRAAATLVAADLGRLLTPDEEADVRDLAEAVGGQPLHLHQAAALAREDGRSFAELARKAARDPQVLDRLSVDALAEEERRVLAVLAIAGGALLPAELIAAMGDAAMIGERLGLLRRRGLVEQHEDRFGLPICHVGGYRQMLLRYVQLASALRALGDWLEARDPGSEEARSATGGALSLLGFAAERTEWPGIVRLVRLLEPVLTLLGRWEASREALEHGLAAARAASDQAAEALFSHQLGTLAFCQDELEQAPELLEHALRLREQLGDHAGAAVTSHNLRQLVPLVPPSPPKVDPGGGGSRWPRRLPVLAARAAVVGLTFLIGTLVFPRVAGTPQQPATTAGGATTTSSRVTLPAPDPKDTTPPVLRLPSDLVVEATSAQGARVAFAASAVDRVDGAVPVTCTPASGSTFPLGVTPVACSAVDRAGFAAGDGFVVTVEDATTPRLDLPSGIAVDATSYAGAAVTYSVSASDSVDGAIAPTCSPASGARFPVGTTTVRCAATDAHGNKASGQFAVTVRGPGQPGGDRTPPVLSVPRDLVVEATSKDGAQVTYTATAVDQVDGTVTARCAPESRGTFPLGVTRVSCTATDKAGNRTDRGFNVTVRDTTAPEPLPPVDLTVEATSASGAAVGYTVSAIDLVDGTVPVSCSQASGSTFPLGVTKVGCTATDKAGNQADFGFEVAVRDTTAPIPPPPVDLTVEATSANGAIVTYDPIATDLVDGKIAMPCVPASGSTFPLGVTKVGCTATDKAGNQADLGFEVTVRDTTEPVLELPDDFEVAATSKRGAVVIYPASATDLVDGEVPVTCSPGSGRWFRLRTTRVRCSAKDNAGNQGRGSFRVTVRDKTPPVLHLPDDMTVLHPDPVTYEASATDNVDPQVTPECKPPSGAGEREFPVNVETPVNCTATDEAGNHAEGSFTVSVVSEVVINEQDPTPPRAN